MKNQSLFRPLILSAFLSYCFVTNATTHIVTNTSNSGIGSLRTAISNTNVSGGDTITFSPSLLSLGNDTIILDSIISINNAVVIQGLSTITDTLFISGQNTTQIFQINHSSGSVVLKKLYLINGFASVTSGGAIKDESFQSVEIESCIFSNNSSSSGGAAYHKTGGELIVKNSMFFNNYSPVSGGVFQFAYTSGLAFSNCTFSGNTSDAGGGGIYVLNSSSLKINKTTFTNNSSLVGLGNGAAILINDIDTFEMKNSTVIDNFSNNNAINIWASVSDGVIKIGSSIIAGNTNGNIYMAGSQLSASSLGYNLIGDPTFIGSISSDQLFIASSAINLGPLQDNGGSTYTMLPSAGSVAINAGNPNDLNDAQNGSITDGFRDAGAAEFNAGTPTTIHIDFSEHSDYVIYPNPSSSRLTIDLLKKPSPVLIKVINVSGKIVFTKEYSQRQKIEVNHFLNPGIYLFEVTIIDENRTHRQKIIIK